jgi:hypothetical protein
MRERTNPFDYDPPFNEDYWPASLSGFESDIWLEYQSDIDALHTDYVRFDQRSGYIYLARMYTDSGWLIKIGRARDPKKREAELNRFPVVMPFRIHIGHTIWAKDAAFVESFLHRQLARYRGEGEWFRFPEEVESALEDIWYADTELGVLKFRQHWDGYSRTFHDHLSNSIQLREESLARMAARKAADE